MDLMTIIELEVRARMAEPTARIVSEELRRHLPSMTLGELHAFLSTEIARGAFHVPLADVLPTPSPPVEEPATDAIPGTENLSWKEANLRFQADLIRKTLVDCGWNTTLTARLLDLSRSYVYAMIEKFGIDHRGAQAASPPHGSDEPESQD